MKTFPMFVQLAGRPVVIVGGGEQAAQKARLMLKTEARINLIAQDPLPELAAHVASGRIALTADLSAAAFRGAVLVFVGTGCPGLDAAARALAKAGGAALVNVVDQPDMCDALTPSIIDRDPVVVAIGTEGTAPVLGRQIREQLEAALEPALGGLAAAAGALRGDVALGIAKPKRRAFWEWVFSGSPRARLARGDLPGAVDDIRAAIAAGGAPGAASGGAPGAASGGAPGMGSIALVGAGPGAADLLTLRALRCLQTADVIFYDRLVDPALLDLARRDAERVFVGKEVGAHAWPQARIDEAIVAAALTGARVVRLKSGDPGVFGRATEEIAAARAAGLPVEIVPGVTAASAAGAALCRSLTERGASDHLVLATGTCRPGDASPDWAGMLRPGTTLALYMAVRAAPAISAALIAGGAPASLEVDIVAEVSTTRERHVGTTLGALPDVIAAHGIAHPAVLFIRWPKAAEQIAAAELRFAAE